MVLNTRKKLYTLPSQELFFKLSTLKGTCRFITPKTTRHTLRPFD